jgi:predicted MFS family arabinose efflux permease
MKQIGIVGLLGLFMVCFLHGGISVLSPAVSGIAKGLNLDPNLVVQIGTFPAIFAVLASLLAGRFAGRVIKNKTFIVASLLISIIGGSLPLFIQNWTVMLFSRACVGFGVGVFFALPPALIMLFYKGDKQRNNLGIANAISSSGGMIMMFLAGVLVDIRWNYVFGVYWLGVFGLILILAGLPEPESAPPEPAKAEKPKASISRPVILNFLLIFLTLTFAMQALLFVSSVVIDKGLGTGVHAGTVAIMFNIAAILLSSIFGLLYKIFKKFLAVFLAGLVSIGLVLLYYAGNLFMAGVGMFLVGSTLVLIPTLLSDNGNYLAPQAITFATSLFMIAMNLGNFIAGFFAQAAAGLAGSEAKLPGLFFAIFGMGATTVVFFVIRLLQKDTAAA